MHPVQQGNGGFGNNNGKGGVGQILVWMMLFISILGSTTVSLAADISLFGPKRYERTQGKPPMYTETFTGCSATGAQAVIKVQNGSSKASSLSSAVVSLNGSSIFSESDFKNHTAWLEKVVSFRPGSNTLTVELKSSGQQETPFLIINVFGRGCDVTPPIITTPQPADGALLNIAHPAISASYADNPGGTGIDQSSVRVTLDSGDISSSCTAGSDGVSCLPPSNLAEGGHTVSVDVSDLSNNSASLGWRFTTDTIAPSLSVTSPPNGQYLNASTVTVSGNTDDPTAHITVDGIVATLTGTSFSAVGVTLAEGANTITAVAVDQAGNRSETAITVTVDTSLPQVTITAPVEGSFTNIPTVTVTGTVSEPPVSVLVNGRATTLTGQAFVLENMPLAEGQNTISVDASDLAGNKGTAIVTVNLDTANPQIFVTTPADGLLTRNSRLTVSGTVSEPLTSLLVNGQAVTVNSLAFTTTVTLSEGANSIVLEAIDRAGNKGAVTFNVTLDSTPPTVPALESLTTPVNNPIVVVKGSAEPGSSVTLSVGGVQLANTTADAVGLFSFTGLTLTEGETIFTAQATDLAGNTGQTSAPLAVTLDTKAPVVAVIAPLDKAILNTRVVAVTGTIDDPTAAVTVNGLPALNSGGIWTLEGFTLQEGSNALLVEARDPAGNKGSATATVTLDTVPPAVSITTPVDGLYTNILLVTATGTVNEEVASITINGVVASVSTTSPSSSTFTAVLTLTEGVNTIVVTAVDRAGNSASSTVTATLDTVAPQLTVIGPADGALLNSGQITFGGAAAEPVVSVLVNGIAAQVGSNGGYTLPVTLAEGSNSLTVTATDRAGNSSTSTITVNLDSTPPAAPLLNAQLTPTRTAATTVAGQAEANSTVTLFNNGVPVATLKADAAGLFSVADVTLAEGNNPFTAQAADAAGNIGQLSAPLTVVLDTKAPVITVTAPQAGALVSAAQVTISGTVDEPLASLTVNVASTPLSNLTFEYVMTLAAGENSALITATDLAGNIATNTVTVLRDSTPPKVVIIAPLYGQLTNSSQVQISGTVDDADAALTVGGAAVVLVNKAFSVGYVLSDGDNSIQVRAVDKAGNEGVATVTVTLDAQPPVVTLNVPATAIAGANVSITINAADNRTLTLAELRANGVPIWSASSTNSASVTEAIGYRLSPDLNAGTEVTLQARALDAAGNEGVFTSKILISQAAAGPGYVQGKVLDDIRGRRMEGATVTVTDSKGATKTAISGSDGGYFFEIPSGDAMITIARPGYTTIERKVMMRPEQKVTVLDARLTSVSGQKNLVDATGGVAKSSPFTIDLVLPTDALANGADLRITPVSNQGVIGTLPLGWSPLAVADVRLLDQTTGTQLERTVFATAATARFTMPVIADLAASTLTLARYDATAHQWIAAGNATPSVDGLSATADILAPGQYAVVIPDPAPNAPSAAQAGQPLAAAALQSLDYSLTTTTGKVVPQASPPSAGLKAAGEVVVTVKSDAAQQPVFTSGLLLGGRITEKFDLLSGDKVEPVSYSQDIVLYRQPCITNIGAGAVTALAVSGIELRTTFPVSPSKDYTIVDLLLGKVGMEILPPDTTETGVMVGTDGGRILDADGNILVIPQGALSQTTPVSTKSVAASAAIGTDFTLLKAVEVNLTRQTLISSATLSIPAPTGLDASLPLVIAKGVTVKGVNKLKLVSLAKQNGSFITSTPLPQELANSSTSINSSGTYYFLQSKGQIGFIIGTVTDASSNPFAGALVKTDSGSLIDLVENSGKYLLAAPVASFNATAMDLYKGDEVTVAGAITSANQAVTLNLVIRMMPPKVVSISPANGATNVQPDVPVVVTFSKPMDKTSLTSATLFVRDSANNPVPGMLTFNVDSTAVTFYPADAFKQETTYSVFIAAAVKDLQGYSLGQDVSSSFIVRRTTPPVMPAAGAVSGTFPDADGYITVTATQGSAASDNTVLLINDTTGEIQSVMPASNGSFIGKIRGQLGDEIKVVLMDYSGNQTTISYLTFKGPDGSYLVTAMGGKIEGEGGSILDIPEGALVGATVLKITPMIETALPHPVPEGGKFLGAVNIDSGGFNFQKEAHLSIPLPTDMPVGAVPFLAKPMELTNADGTIEKVYEIIDSTKIINGRLSTASPPFDGITGFGSFVFLFVAGPVIGDVIVSGTTYRDMDGLPGYDSVTDKPVYGAVIRSPQSINFVSYSKADGHYATFGFAANGSCRNFPIAAVHPQTMFKSTVNITTCDTPYIVNNLNFKLADKDTVLPDKTAPIISLGAQVAPSQAPDVRIIAGTVQVGTEISIPVSILDQQMGSATMTVIFTDTTSNEIISVLLSQSGTPTLFTPVTGAKPAIWRYSLVTTFQSPIAAPNPINFRPSRVGLYSFVVEATDNAGNKSRQFLQLRAVSADTSLGESKDGPPTVDSLTPSNGSKDVMVSIPITAVFNEPVTNVDSISFKLIDLTAGRAPGVTTEIIVPATITTGIVNGRMQAVLTPKGNLYYDRDYQVVLNSAIKDLPDKNDSATTADKRFPLAEVCTTFSTKKPTSYDLAYNQFSGRDIDLYYSRETMKLFTYVTAGDQGWRIVEVTDPTSAQVVWPRPDLGIPSADFKFSADFNYRSVAVHPDPNKALMAMTDTVNFSDGNQYGYVRFYSLLNPVLPVLAGREKLAEAYSGIPGRIALYGDYAFVATINAGLQVVSISQASANLTENKPSDGSTIVGIFDSVGQGLGQPNDVLVLNGINALLTTTSGSLITLDITEPSFPMLVTNIGQNDGRRFSRIAAAMQYQYMDTSNMPQSMDLVIASSQEGKIRTIDMSNPASPQVLAVAQDETGLVDAAITAMDLVINKESGLAFATSLGTVYVIDIKDPFKPKVINRFTSLYNPTDPSISIPLGQTPAIVERGGWIYAANQQKGVKILNFDPPTIVPDPGRYFVLLDEDNKATRDYQFSYKIQTDPGTNGDFENMRVILQKDYNEIHKFTDVLPDTPMTLIESGMKFELNSTYQAMVVVYDKNTKNDVYSPAIPIVAGKFEISAEDDKYRNLKGATTDGTAILKLELKVTKNYKSYKPVFSLEDPDLGNDTNATGQMLYQGGWTGAFVAQFDDATQSFKATYRVPQTYVRYGTSMEEADKTSAERVVNVDLGVTDIKPVIKLTRPPVVLVHGLWADPVSWKVFKSSLNKFEQYSVETANYKDTNADAITKNFGVVQSNLKTARDNMIADGFFLQKLNVIGHSMGGLLTKEYCRNNNADCKQKIGKFISIDTPHKGSYLANIVENINLTKPSLPLLQPLSCYTMLSKLEKNGKKVWKDGTNKAELTGALIDLRINSTAIALLDLYTPPFNWTAVAGITENGVNGYNEDISKLWIGLRFLCSKVPDTSFSTVSNSPVFDGQNDRIVSLTSQYGNAPQSLKINQVDHSSVLESDETVKQIREILEK